MESPCDEARLIKFFVGCAFFGYGKYFSDVLAIARTRDPHVEVTKAPFTRRRFRPKSFRNRCISMSRLHENAINATVFLRKRKRFLKCFFPKTYSVCHHVNTPKQRSGWKRKMADSPPSHTAANCLTMLQLLVLFIDRNILEDQDIYQSVHLPECLTMYSYISVSRSSTSSSLHWKQSCCLPRRMVIFFVAER